MKILDYRYTALKDDVLIKLLSGSHFGDELFDILHLNGNAVTKKSIPALLNWIQNNNKNGRKINIKLFFGEIAYLILSNSKNSSVCDTVVEAHFECKINAGLTLFVRGVYFPQSEEENIILDTLSMMENNIYHLSYLQLYFLWEMGESGNVEWLIRCISESNQLKLVRIEKVKELLCESARRIYNAALRRGTRLDIPTELDLVAEDNESLERLPANLLSLKCCAIESDIIYSGTLVRLSIINPGLMKLNLSGMNLGIRDFVSLGEGLEDHPTLLYLNISGNGATYKKIKPIASALSTNKCLQTLDVSENNLATKGCSALAVALSINKTLTSLNIAENPGSKHGTKQLCISLIYNIKSALTELNISISKQISLLYVSKLLLSKNYVLKRLTFYTDGKEDKIKLKMLADAIKVNSSLGEIVMLTGWMGSIDPLLIQAIQHNHNIFSLGKIKEDRSIPTAIQELIEKRKRRVTNWIMLGVSIYFTRINNTHAFLNKIPFSVLIGMIGNLLPEQDAAVAVEEKPTITPPIAIDWTGCLFFKREAKSCDKRLLDLFSSFTVR